MQSWGTRSRYTERDTELEPSKSGIAGLVCAALGWERARDVTPIAALRFGVRVDREGVLERDYHTAGAGLGIIRASGALSRDAVLSNRYYLADADFLCGLEGPDEAFLREIEGALREPVWQLSLGRKSFLPSVPIHLPFEGGLRSLPLEDALRAEPWPLVPRTWRWEPHEQADLRLVIETTPVGPRMRKHGWTSRLERPSGTAASAHAIRQSTVTVSRHEERNHVP